MIIRINSTYNDIREALGNIKKTMPNMAYISYIDGEFGSRAWLYNSIVKVFSLKMKSDNIPVVGFCFSGNTLFLKEHCDIIIELTDTKFIDDNTDLDENVKEHFEMFRIHVPSETIYMGNDGWNHHYIRGVSYPKYEKILLEFDFKNIFFTCHFDGAHYKTIHSFGKVKETIYGLIDGNAIMSDKLLVEYAVPLPPKIMKKNGKIATWIRNTNKWPERNTPEEIYKGLFDYCIQNNKKLFVFLDLKPVDVPNHPLIEVCNIRNNNIPNCDKFIDIVSECDMFIGSDSGFTEIGAYYSNIPVYVHKTCSEFLQKSCEPVCFKDTKSLIDILDKYYSI